MFTSILSKIKTAVVNTLHAIGTALSHVHWAIPAVAITALIFLM
jgi:hypothetical protein